jgi:SPP1 gp7 family putative phage head morphogenesis protein
LAKKGGLLDTAQQMNEDFRLKASAALTASEAATLKQVVNEMTGDVWSQALYDELSLMVESGYVSAGDLVEASGAQIDFEFGNVPSTTLDAIRKQAEQFAFMVNQREQQAIFDVVDTAVAEGQTPKELAGVIQDTFAEGYHIQTPDGVDKRVPTDAWSKMVARTELSRAQTMGAMSLYDTAGIEKVEWVTSGTACDECEPLEGQIFRLDDVDEPPLHPNCACSLVPADEDVAYERAA